MTPSVPCTRVVAALRMKQIALDNQSRMIRRLRAKLEIERRELAATREGLETKKIERMKAKKQHAREIHVECHHKLHAHIQEAEDTIQEQHLIIEALVEEKASLLQTIQGLQEDNGAPAPFVDE
ncbi:Pectinesterase-2 precursor [Dorcoceras hygrometricum]|uniref:Pectinesterase-2 n=1 Tax=Dorcoceras hygrometricum TaxID=472368 RepID=A0A2Z7BH96_9LAMI|nr:Pectinesterase-2 precursor [Dorcoceras hygrometricum]